MTTTEERPRYKWLERYKVVRNRIMSEDPVVKLKRDPEADARILVELMDELVAKVVTIDAPADPPADPTPTEEG